MSYDIRLGVKVEGGNDLFVEIDRPEYDSPTYNIGTMFRACMDWDFEQGKWYNVQEVLPKIQHGLTELMIHEGKYKQYNAPNGWWTTASAKRTLESVMECISRNIPEGNSLWSINEIPIELLYIKW